MSYQQLNDGIYGVSPKARESLGYQRRKKKQKKVHCENGTTNVPINAEFIHFSVS